MFAARPHRYTAAACRTNHSAQFNDNIVAVTTTAADPAAVDSSRLADRTQARASALPRPSVAGPT